MGGDNSNPNQIPQHPNMKRDTLNPNQMTQHLHARSDTSNPKTLKQMIHQKLPTSQGGRHFKPLHLETDNSIEALNKSTQQTSTEEDEVLKQLQ